VRGAGWEKRRRGRGFRGRKEGERVGEAWSRAGGEEGRERDEYRGGEGGEVGRVGGGEGRQGIGGGGESWGGEDEERRWRWLGGRGRRV